VEIINVEKYNRVFLVINEKTKEKKVLKMLNSSSSSISSSIIIESEDGIGMSNKCPYLIHYYGIIENDGNKFILLEYFSSGDL
jgi:serine/threonine protein kinase